LYILIIFSLIFNIKHLKFDSNIKKPIPATSTLEDKKEGKNTKVTGNNVKNINIIIRNLIKTVF